MGERNGGKTDMEENFLDLDLPSKDKSSHSSDSADVNEHIRLDPKIKEYGLLDSMQDTEDFLLSNPEIIDGPTALSLLEWCTAVTDDVETFNKVSRQCIYIIYLYDLSRQVNIEPVHCVTPFFAKIAEPMFRERFEKEIVAYRSKLQSLTYDEVLQEVLICTSPGDSSPTSSSSSEDYSFALDPLEVYNNLPSQLRQCLDDEDLVALEYELSELPLDRAKYYFVQFIRSGLLLPIENEETADLSREDDNSSNVSLKILIKVKTMEELRNQSERELRN
ncbi:hsp90 co-chaperone Cdc37-like [Diaphorina citri]|uniref:Hsp90 co-chaperone Cdc37-like n=1 Tax=Diaphorina citri TaxID=121845 RepID=A0A1S3D2U3_DIACI|nr:hsp90 co-chaperone Cdc37-like [Diaphorina citri]